MEYSIDNYDKEISLRRIRNKFSDIYWCIQFVTFPLTRQVPDYTDPKSRDQDSLAEMAIIKIDRRKDDKTSVAQWLSRLASSLYIEPRWRVRTRTRSQEIRERESDNKPSIQCWWLLGQDSENAIIEIEGIEPVEWTQTFILVCGRILSLTYPGESWNARICSSIELLGKFIKDSV